MKLTAEQREPMCLVCQMGITDNPCYCDELTAHTEPGDKHMMKLMCPDCNSIHICNRCLLCGYQWDAHTEPEDEIVHSIAREQEAKLHYTEPEDECDWSREQEDSDMFLTSCNQIFCLNDGATPFQNGMSYCCFCGRRLEGHPPPAHTEPEDECECGTKMQTMAYGIDGMYRKQFCPNCKPNTEPEDECEVCALMPEDERLCHTEPEDDFDPAYYWEHMSEEHKYSICEKIDIQIALRKIEEFEKTIEQWFKDNWKSGVPRTWRNCISTMKNWLQQEDK